MLTKRSGTAGIPAAGDTDGSPWLTGSRQFGLMSGITQSLARRVGRIELPPCHANFGKRMVKSPNLYSAPYLLDFAELVHSDEISGRE